MFKKTVLVGLLFSSLAAPAFAEKSSKEENIGVSLGAVIGGVAGGPIGLVVGAVFGAKVGDEMHQREEAVETLTSSLNGSNQQVEALEQDIRALNGEIQMIDGELREAREYARPELLALLEAGIEMDLLFRTGEDNLADATGGKLGQLATSLAGNPDIKIRLDGYADERGDSVYNQDLSLRRAEHVRDLLVMQGIPDSRITINAHGESPVTEATADNYALERRVSLVLYMSDTPSVASNPR